MKRTATTTASEPRQEWFASWFDSPHYHRLYAQRDAREATAFIDRLVNFLEPRAQAAVLDLGCGSGRHSRALAARGFEVTGIDLSAESLARARSQPGPRAHFVEQDMRDPFGTRAFDYVLSLFTSFGYFDNRADHFTVVVNMAQSLRPGGTLVLDYLNVDHVERHLIAEEAIERDGVCYRLSRWSDAEAIYKRILIEEPGAAPREFVERVARLTLVDFALMFSILGLHVSDAYGDYELRPFHADSPRLILIATRAPDDRGALSLREVLADPAERFGSHPEV